MRLHDATGEDSLRLFAKRRHHDDRYIAVGARLPAYIQPAAPRELGAFSRFDRDGVAALITAPARSARPSHLSASVPVKAQEQSVVRERSPGKYSDRGPSDEVE